MSERLDMGRIHDGFYAGLFHSDPDKGSLYSQIVDELDALNIEPTTPILLAGRCSLYNNSLSISKYQP